MPARTEFITREGNFRHEKLGFLTVEMAGHRRVGHEVSKRTAKKARCCLHICQIVHHTPVAVLLRHGLTIPHSHGNCCLILKLTNLGAHLWVFNVFHFIFREGSLHASGKVYQGHCWEAVRIPFLKAAKSKKQAHARTVLCVGNTFFLALG